MNPLLLLAPLVLPFASPQATAPRTLGPVRELCFDTIRDQATGVCIEASSTPTLGLLYPLSASFFVDVLGRVGVGTAAPARELDVVGVARASGGFEFPDGTLQTTATLQGPPGPPGPLAPPEPTLVLGTATNGAVASTADLFDLLLAVRIPTGGQAQGTFTFAKGLDRATTVLADAARTGATLPDVTLAFGPAVLTLTMVTVPDWELLTLPDGAPREKVTLAPRSLNLTYAGTSTSMVDWDLFTMMVSVSPSVAGAKLVFARPDQDPQPHSTDPLLEVQHAVVTPVAGDLRLVRPFDALTPSLLGLGLRRQALAEVTARLLRFDPAVPGDREVLSYFLSAAVVRELVLRLDPATGELVEELELDASTTVLTVDPDGGGPSSVTL